MSRLVLLGLWGVFVACVPCEDVAPEFGNACLPETMAANETLRIEVQEDCGTNCSAPLDCTASVDFERVTIIATQTECLLDCVPDGVCRKRTTECLLPPLAAGDYEVVFPGLSTKTLRVESGAASACRL